MVVSLGGEYGSELMGMKRRRVRRRRRNGWVRREEGRGEERQQIKCQVKERMAG